MGGEGKYRPSTRKTPIFLQDNDLRIVLFGGKGGVGKTTCAASTAWSMALKHPQESFLVISTDPAHSLLDSLADSPIPPNLRALELDPEECLANFKARFGQALKTIAARGTFLDDDDTSALLDLSLPGLDELMAVLEIAGWMEEGRFRCIVVDTAPTGHTLRLLQMPGLIRKWLVALDVLHAKHRYMKALFAGIYQPDEIDDFLIGLTQSAIKAENMLQDADHCLFVPVTVAETLSISETEALLAELRQLKIPTTDVVINMLYPEMPCEVCSDHRSRQTARLSNMWNEPCLNGLALWGAPLRPDEIRGADGLVSFWTNVTPIARPRRTASVLSPQPIPKIEAPPALPAPQTRLLFFGGKGGVGKTTLACATALRLAREMPGREIFLFSIDPAHSLSKCLENDIGNAPVRIAPGLTAMEIDARSEFESLKARYLAELKDFFSGSDSMDLTFDRQVMESLLDLAPPGLDEVMALIRGLELLERDGQDVIVFDSAPTGHLLRLLELPDLIDQWLRAVFNILLKYRDVFRAPGLSARLVTLSRGLKQFREMLRDPDRSAVYTVAILTEMAFEETRDLVTACQRLEVGIRGLFLNLATTESECPLCSALHQRESRIERKFSDSFSEIPRTLIYRSAELRGYNKLMDLGRNMFHGPLWE